MCGFLGVIDKKNIFSKESIESASNFIHRRGPDYSGYELVKSFESDIHLSHKRLSIIDLSNDANQPFFDENRNWALIFNGEIYNYKEIKLKLEKQNIKFKTNSDTEVIIKSFDYWGIKCLKHFIGMFSFMITNLKSGICYVVRDRAGVKPLYYYHSKNAFIASSDLRSVNHLIKNKTTLNLSAIESFFNLGYSELESSYINQIQKLPKGCYLKIDLKNYDYKVFKYWDPLTFFNDEYLNISESEILDQLEDLITSAFKYRMISDVPVGVFLSGGYDSSLVSAILSKKAGYKINSYSIGFEDPKYNEADHAKKVAKYLDLNHTEKICTERDAVDLIEKLVDVYDEPFGDSSAIPTLLVSELASKDVKVVLSADGGDEIFGGYSKYSTSINAYKKINSIPNFALKLLDASPESLINPLLSFSLKRKLNNEHVKKLKKIIKSNSLLDLCMTLGKNPQSDIFNKEYKSIIDTKIYNNLDDINKMLVYDYNNYLEGDILKKVDRATMYYSIEGREPLLDHRIFEFMAKIHPKYKLSKSLEKKYLLKKITHKYLPTEIMDRPKMGFRIPISSWIKSNKKLNQLFFDTISESNIKQCDFLDYKKIENQKNNFLKENNSSGLTLWYLYNFLRWKNSLQL